MEYADNSNKDESYVIYLCDGCFFEYISFGLTNVMFSTLS